MTQLKRDNLCVIYQNSFPLKVACIKATLLYFGHSCPFLILLGSELLRERAGWGLLFYSAYALGWISTPVFVFRNAYSLICSGIAAWSQALGFQIQCPMLECCYYMQAIFTHCKDVSEIKEKIEQDKVGILQLRRSIQVCGTSFLLIPHSQPGVGRCEITHLGNVLYSR